MNMSSSVKNTEKAQLITLRQLNTLVNILSSPVEERCIATSMVEMCITKLHIHRRNLRLQTSSFLLHLSFVNLITAREIQQAIINTSDEEFDWYYTREQDLKSAIVLRNPEGANAFIAITDQFDSETLPNRIIALERCAFAT